MEEKELAAVEAPVEQEAAPAEETVAETQPEQEAPVAEAEAPAEEPESPAAEVEAAVADTEEPPADQPVINAEDLVTPTERPAVDPDIELKALLEAVIYVTDEPLTAQQMAAAVGQPLERINPILAQLVDDYSRPERGLMVKEVAGGYKMATKPEHHEAIRQFVKNLKPALKLSLAALETLAVIAYKQPITSPEIMEIRGVQGAGVLKTLLDRKLITTAGRKNVVGKPMLYKTTKEFLVQFGLKDLAELPTLKEFEELRRLAVTDDTEPEPEAAPAETPNTVAEQASEEQTAGAEHAAGTAEAFTTDQAITPAQPEPQPEQASAEEAPVSEPPSEEPPAEEPAQEQPPVDEPPAEEPSVEEPKE